MTEAHAPAHGSVVGVLLAAGAGRRLGGPKALLHDPVRGPLLRTQCARLQAAGCSRVVVVLGCGAGAARPLVPAGAEVVVAADWESGMGASIRAGLLAAQSDDPTAVLLTLVDLVDVPTAAHARLLARAHESALGRVFWGGRPGHPVLLGSCLLYTSDAADE